MNNKPINDKSDSSSADNVDRHLQTLEDKASSAPQRQLSIEEQLFTEEELARLINPDKLNNLMGSSDDLISYLASETDRSD